MQSTNGLKLSIALQLAAVLILGVFAANMVQKLGHASKAAEDQQASIRQAVAALTAAKTDMYLSQQGAVLAALIGDGSRAASLQAQFQVSSEELSRTFESLQRLTAGTGSEPLLAKLQADANQWQAESREIMRLSANGDPAVAARRSQETILPIYQHVGQWAAQIEENGQRSLDNQVQTTVDEYTLWVGVFVLLIYAVCVGVYLRTVARGEECIPVANEDRSVAVVPWLSPEM